MFRKIALIYSVLDNETNLSSVQCLSVKWKMRSAESGVWKMRSVQNAECGKFSLIV